MIDIKITADNIAEALCQLTELAAILERAGVQTNAVDNTNVIPDAPTVVPVTLMPTTPIAPAAPIIAPTVPTTAMSYTLDQLTTASAPIIDAGRLLDLQNLLQKYGIQALPQLPQDKYGDFATDLRQLGAQI